MISFDRYISITSGVGAGQTVRRRDFILRILSDQSVFLPGVTYEFGNPDALAAFMGPTFADSPVYKRAVRYFGFTNKNVQRPKKISVSAYISASSGTPPRIIGDMSTKSLSLLQNAAGALTLVADGTQYVVSPIDTSSAQSLAAVAIAINTALAAATSAPDRIKSGTVAYNAVTNQFNFTAGGTAGGGTITAVTGEANDLGQYMGWNVGQATFVPGLTQDTPLTAVQRSAATSTNFGSFVYEVSTFNPNTPIPTADQLTAVADWNKAQNNKYMFLWGVNSANAGTIQTAVNGRAGVGLTLYATGVANDYSDQCPGEILAATNYALVGSVQNYMFYQFPTRNITVSDDITANSMDNRRVNYIGVTETAGQQLAFYQRGVLQGGPQDAIDMNVYANEMWLKDDVSAGFMSMLINSPRVPANSEGRSQGLAVLQTSVDRAKSNGVISVGKTLNNDQKAYITTMTNDPKAWRQVETLGYYMDVFFNETTTTDGRTEIVMNYYLIYGKDDVIRQVVGSNILI